MKTDDEGVLPVPHNSLLLGSSFNITDLLTVTVTKVLQLALDVVAHYANHV